MSVAAVVVAGGRGLRFGGLKQFLPFRGSTVAAHAVATARTVCDVVVLVVPEGYAGNGEGADRVVVGGETRSASVRAGLAHVTDADVVVIHDAARPFASPQLFAAVVAAVTGGADGAIPAIAISDTVKRVRDGVVESTIARDELVTVQTPQAFHGLALRRAHLQGADATDDAALIEANGGTVVTVPGEYGNVKLTVPGDLTRGAGSSTMRIGHGYDVHRVSDDPNRPLWIGLVQIPSAPGLIGHSDADVATHALCDALLGAAGLGDLGRHFPDSDAQFAGVASRTLVEAVCIKLAEQGFRVVSGDVTIIAERPRLLPFMAAMETELTAVVGAPISVKATTAEGLGALGRGEGIAANAVVLVEEKR